MLPRARAAKRRRSARAEPVRKSEREQLDIEIARLRGLDVGTLQARWHAVFGRRAPSHLPRHLLFRVLAYRTQADVMGDSTLR